MIYYCIIRYNTAFRVCSLQYRISYLSLVYLLYYIYTNRLPGRYLYSIPIYLGSIYIDKYTSEFPSYYKPSRRNSVIIIIIIIIIIDVDTTADSMPLIRFERCVYAVPLTCCSTRDLWPRTYIPISQDTRPGTHYIESRETAIII